MAAVLAVAVLLLCSSVRSEEVLGSVTQVKVSDLPTPPNDTGMVITNPTEGSSDTHSAVLANQVLESEDHGPLVLVDLARADNQEMSNMTTALPPPAPEALGIPDESDTVLAADTTTVPEGFDMNESDAGSNTTVATVQEDGSTVLAADTTPVPEGFDLNEFDEGSDSVAGTNQHDGPLVLADTTPVPKEFDTNEFDEGSVGSFYDEPESLAATQDNEGTLVPGFPTIGNSQDNIHGPGHGVQTYDAGSGGGDSFTAYEDDSSFADQGILDEGYPVVQDDSQGQGYGAQTYGGEDSFSTAYNYNDDPSFADQGTLVHGFPGIGSNQDNNQGAGYGVQTYDAGSAGGVGVVRPYGPFYGRP